MEECCVCTERMAHAVHVGPCAHEVCCECLERLRAHGHRSCPLCRGPMDHGVTRLEPVPVDAERVRTRAYYLSLDDPTGDAAEHWLRAEAIERQLARTRVVIEFRGHARAGPRASAARLSPVRSPIGFG